MTKNDQLKNTALRSFLQLRMTILPLAMNSLKYLEQNKDLGVPKFPTGLPAHEQLFICATEIYSSAINTLEAIQDEDKIAKEVVKACVLTETDKLLWLNQCSVIVERAIRILQPNFAGFPMTSFD